MAVTSTTPSISFTANGSTTDFAFNFVVPATDTTGTITDATADMGLGSAVLTVDTAGLFYTSDLQGKAITVTGAGVSSADLTTTILSVDSATQITLNASASTAVTNTNISITTGTFNTTLKNNTDLLVFVDGTQKTITTDYTVRLNLGDDANKAGTVIFNSAPSNGAAVVIIRDVTLQRTTDFQTGGALTAKSLNAQFDNVIMAVQDTQFDTAASAIKFPSDETLSTTTLPAAATRGNKTLGFNSSGEIDMKDDLTTGSFAITGTTITASTGFVGNVTGNITGDITGDITGQVTGDISSTGTSTFTTVDIDGGTIDGTVIGGTTPAAVTTTSLTATTADINGGAIDNTAIGGVNQAAGAFTTLTSLSTTNFTSGFTAAGLAYPTSDGTNEQVLSTDGSGNLSFRSIAGLSLFTALTDTPTTYVGQDAKYLKVDESSSTVVFDALTTDDVTEGANLYYTDARARAAVSVNDAGGDGSLAYNSSTGVFTYTGPSASEVRAHISVTDSGGDGSLAYDNSTGIITYTGPSASEVRAHFTGGTGISITSGDVALDFTEFSTTNVVEGTNLYYTTARSNADFDTRLATKTTDNLTEGSSNLYYTDARAQAVSINNVVEDTTPQLGGDLDTQTNALTGTTVTPSTGSYGGFSSSDSRAVRLQGPTAGKDHAIIMQQGTGSDVGKQNLAFVIDTDGSYSGVDHGGGNIGSGLIYSPLNMQIRDRGESTKTRTTFDIGVPYRGNTGSTITQGSVTGKLLDVRASDRKIYLQGVSGGSFATSTATTGVVTGTVTAVNSIGTNAVELTYDTDFNSTATTSDLADIGFARFSARDVLNTNGMRTSEPELHLEAGRIALESNGTKQIDIADAGGMTLTTRSNGNIDVTPNGTGQVRIDTDITELYSTKGLIIHDGAQGTYLDLTSGGANHSALYGAGIHVEETGAGPQLSLFSHKSNGATAYPNLWAHRSRDDGSGNKDFLNSDDIVFSFFGAAYDGNTGGGEGTFRKTAAVELKASENHSSSAGGGKIEFHTVDNGTQSYAGSKRLTIDNNIELNTSLDVNGQDIISVSSGNIDIKPDGTSSGASSGGGKVVLGGGSEYDSTNNSYRPNGGVKVEKGLTVAGDNFLDVLHTRRESTTSGNYSIEVANDYTTNAFTAGGTAGSFGMAAYSDNSSSLGYVYPAFIQGLIGDGGDITNGGGGPTNNGVQIRTFDTGGHGSSYADTTSAAEFRATSTKLMNDKLNLTYAGNTVTVETAGTVNDKIAFKNRTLEIGENASDDNTDKGFEIKYNDGSAKVAFLGYDDSTGKITYIPDSTNTSSVFSGTVGAFDLSGTPIGDLSNVDLSGTLTVGHFLKWNGTNFVLGENPLATMGADLNTAGFTIKADGAYGVGVSTSDEGNHNLKLSAGYLDAGAGQQDKPGDVEIKHARSVRFELEHIDTDGTSQTWGRDKPAEIIFGQNHTDGYFDSTKNTTPNNALDYGLGDAKITMRSSSDGEDSASKYGGLLTTEFFKGSQDDDTLFGNNTSQNSGLGGERTELQIPHANDMVLSAFPMGSFYYNVNSGSSFGTTGSDEPFDRNQIDDGNIWATHTGVGARYAYTPEGRVVVRTARRTGEKWDDGTNTRYQIRNEDVVSFGVPETLATNGNTYWDVNDSTNQEANGGLTNLKNRTPVAEFHAPVVLEKLGDFAITAATKAAIIDGTEADGSPHQDIVLTVPGHNFSLGEIIEINDVGGMTQLNGNQYIVADTGADGTDKFRLRQYPTNVKLMENGNSFSTYTSGGTVRKVRGYLTEGSLAYDTVKDNFIIHNGTAWGDVHTSLKPSVLANLTTTERNALTGVAGMTIFNTTESRIEYHDGSGWKYISGTSV